MSGTIPTDGHGCTRKCPSNANQLTVAPALLASFALQEALVSGNALVVQRQLSSHIVEGGSNDCWRVKGSQKTLYDDLRRLFEPQPDNLPETSAIFNDFVSMQTVLACLGRDHQRTASCVSRLADAFQVVHTSETDGVVPVRCGMV